MRGEVSKIVHYLGDSKVLHHKLKTYDDLEKFAKSGVPKQGLRKLADYVSRGENTTSFIYKVVPEATYKRNKKLSPEVGEKTIRIARLLAITIFILGTEDRAVDFLNKSHMQLGGIPIDLALTEIGARRVEELLWKIYYGLPA